FSCISWRTCGKLHSDFTLSSQSYFFNSSLSAASEVRPGFHEPGRLDDLDRVCGRHEDLRHKRIGMQRNRRHDLLELIGLEGAGISTGRLSSWKGWRCEQNREADRHASSRCSVDLATHRSLPRRRLWIGRNRARGGTLPPSGSAVSSVCDR